MGTKTVMRTTLSSSRYRSKRVFELEHIFFEEWLCVALEEELVVAGDHTALDILVESIILLRNDDGQLRAFYNACR